MCGRFSLFEEFGVVQRVFQLNVLPKFPPRWNIAPSQEIAIVRAEGAERRCDLARWGLIPAWAKDSKIGVKMINARAETVFEKPAYRAAAKARRCLIPASGFFEWRKEGKTKQPYFFHPTKRECFAFAGLWEEWTDPEGVRITSATILTTTANDVVQIAHARMPVILGPADFDLWCDPHGKDAARIAPLLRPLDETEIAARPVATFVNSPRNDAPACVAPRADAGA